MTKNESKYFNTARKMDEALITLLDRKDFEYITVKDICAGAGVNRSTFYLHYETISDLLEETMQYLLDRFQSYFTDTAGQLIAEIPDRPLNELVFIREKYLVPYLKFIMENKAVFSATFKQTQVMRADRQYESLYRYFIGPILDRFSVAEELRDYYMAFFISGIMAVIREWLKNGCKEEPEEVSEIIEGLVLRENRDRE